MKNWDIIDCSMFMMSTGIAALMWSAVWLIFTRL